MTRILLSVSGPNHIPYFAMQAESRIAKESVLDINSVLSHLIGGNRSRTVIKRFEPNLRLVERRIATTDRLAVYSVWLEADNPAIVACLDEMKVRHGLRSLREKAEQDLRDLGQRLEADLSAGRFDLSHIKGDDRTWRAKEFVERAEAVSKLGDELQCLKIVEASFPDA